MNEDINYILFDLKGEALPLVSSYKFGEYKISENEASQLLSINSTRFTSKDGTKSYLINLNNVLSMDKKYNCVNFQEGMGIAGVEIDDSIALSYDMRDAEHFSRQRFENYFDWSYNRSEFDGRSAFSF